MANQKSTARAKPRPRAVSTKAFDCADVATTFLAQPKAGRSKSLYAGKLGKNIPWKEIIALIRSNPDTEAVKKFIARKHVEAMVLLFEHYGLGKPLDSQEATAKLVFHLAWNHVPAFQIGRPRKGSKQWNHPKIIAFHLKRAGLTRKGRRHSLSMDPFSPLPEQAPALLLNNVEEVVRKKGGTVKAALFELLTTEARDQSISTTKHTQKYLQRLQKRISIAKRKFR